MKHIPTGPTDGGYKTLILLLKMFILCSTLPITSSSEHSLIRVRYSELKRLGVSCYPNDTCTEVQREDSLMTSKCHCGSYCTKYDTCCLDSRFWNAAQHQRSKVHFSCVTVYKNFSDSVFMVDRCKHGWRGEGYIKDMCLGDGQKLNDPLLLIPVTNTKTQDTYKNYFCAACNDDIADVTSWRMRITGFSVEISTTSLQNLRFNSRGAGWAIQDGGQQRSLRLQLEVPHRISRHVKACLHNVTSGCSRSWSHDVTRRKCASYMAIIEVDDKRYRNIHCAICNFKNPGKAKCSPSRRWSGGGFGRRPISSSVILEVNRSGGNRRGEVNRCKETEVFDPFSKQCRALKCVFPSQTIKDGKCVRG